MVPFASLMIASALFVINTYVFRFQSSGPISSYAQSSGWQRCHFRLCNQQTDEFEDETSQTLLLGLPHYLRLWGESVSNWILEIKDRMIYCKRESHSEP
ncbi:hypothetical protein E4U22_008313 [Claviceps purpurea]|nr:hypothetical protein E4U35_006209 [Claviceps purpurea]KAG6225475.1 hypothetical protein E4U26_003027 [Claviceps purpurea]KAG6309813.1 hypothetical protein E4U44_006377 [Claviceps purpurea]KAG6314939.1 hypothetical protein E4U22_008313 [Claviceps purpurea]